MYPEGKLLELFFLDLSKAFDRVWHEGLLCKLKCNGIDGNLLGLFKDFLRNRRRHVVLSGKSSNWSTVSAGAPHGSVLGPLFFLVYINDPTENVSCSVKLFADDTSLFSVVKNEYDTGFDMNRDLEKSECGHGSGKCCLMLIKQRKLSSLGKELRHIIPFSN